LKFAQLHYMSMLTSHPSQSSASQLPHSCKLIIYTNLNILIHLAHFIKTNKIHKNHNKIIETKEQD